MTWLSVTCNLENEAAEFSSEFSQEFGSLYGGSVIFDVTDSTADDVVESSTLADYFNSIVGA